MAREIETLELLSAYLSGDVRPQERSAVEAMLAGDAELRALADELRQTLGELQHGQRPVNESLLRQLRERIAQRIAQQNRDADAVDAGAPDAAAFVAASLSDDLEAAERGTLEEHLARNPAARRERESLRALSSVLNKGQRPVTAEMSGKLRDRLRVAGKLTVGPASVPVGNAKTPVLPASKDSVRVFAAPQRVWPQRIAWLGAAAAAAAMLTLGLWRLTRPDPAGPSLTNNPLPPDRTAPPEKGPEKTVVDNRQQPSELSVPEPRESPRIVEKPPEAPRVPLPNPELAPPKTPDTKVARTPEPDASKPVVEAPTPRNAVQPNSTLPNEPKAPNEKVAETKTPAPNTPNEIARDNPIVPAPGNFIPPEGHAANANAGGGGIVIPSATQNAAVATNPGAAAPPRPAAYATVNTIKDGTVLVQAPGEGQPHALSPQEHIASGTVIRTDISRTSLALPDGGKLLINSGTNLKLTFSAGHASIVLSSGEIYFQGGGTLDLSAGQVKLHKAAVADANIEGKTVRFTELDAQSSVSAKGNTLRGEASVEAALDGSETPHKFVPAKKAAALDWRLGLDVHVTSDPAAGTPTPAQHETPKKRTRTQYAQTR